MGHTVSLTRGLSFFLFPLGIVYTRIEVVLIIWTLDQEHKHWLINVLFQMLKNLMCKLKWFLQIMNMIHEWDEQAGQRVQLGRTERGEDEESDLWGVVVRGGHGLRRDGRSLLLLLFYLSVSPLDSKM